MKCDSCGKFCTTLYPVYGIPPQQVGIDREVCGTCRGGTVSCPRCGESTLTALHVVDGCRS